MEGPLAEEQDIARMGTVEGGGMEPERSQLGASFLTY